MNTVKPITQVRHIQAEPAETWVIKHSHGYPVVDAFTTYGGKVQKILPKSVVYIDKTTVELTFTSARAGFATVAL
jgi:hypothetical protein